MPKTKIKSAKLPYHKKIKGRLINPRGYLSWTQISLWLRSPETYVRRYMYDGEDIKNARMDFGSKVATALETGEPSDDELVNQLVTLLPRYDDEVREQEFKVPFDLKEGSTFLLGKLDKFSPRKLAIREVKTGTQKWTQIRANKHKQLLHYAALVWLEYKQLPSEVYLDWAQTEVTDDGSIVLTGSIRSFKVKIDLRDILEYLATAAKVAKEIDARYRAELEKMA